MWLPESSHLSQISPTLPPQQCPLMDKILEWWLFYMSNLLIYIAQRYYLSNEQLNYADAYATIVIRNESF